MPQSSQTTSRRDDLIAILRHGGARTDETANYVVDAFANEVLREEAEQQKAVPKTERALWQAIADALNAAGSAGMAVGIDLDGTLTDHNAWSVVWDRDAKQWTLAGYDAEGGAA
ncbi:hypothetical protein [Streptomyces europaeiscabiei]|uniref:hypothetical protein n=1 Tax=Streptomyces europaeiscabiei TaxID=146819 RepID=UPI0029B8AF5E|nr:hypothetical protein [Streptomyces europaeiscabiei]MDX2761619.1 hypothetical protein [Streptomyces europaeiscabiei]